MAVDPKLAARLEDAWARHYEARAKFKSEALPLLLAARTGTNLSGPALEKALDVFADIICVVPTLDVVSTYNAAQAVATMVEAGPDAPDPDEDVPVPVLDQIDPEFARSWLKHASLAEITEALDEMTDADHRDEWAQRLYEWARIDGHKHGVLAYLAVICTPELSDAEVVELGPYIADLDDVTLRAEP